MSREDPQLRIRLPIELKEKVDESAKANGRSMNAEIVQRLDASFLNEIPSDELISAKDALHIVDKAKEELSNIIFKRTFAEINKKIRIGHTSFHIDLGDLDLDGINDDGFESVFQLTFDRLKELGYVVLEKSWDVSGFLVEIPKK
ncbi:Arc-like DNA binding domain protein [compost metagenome]